MTEAGFDPKGIDGWYGQDTANAIFAFQQANSLAATGTLDDVAWPVLMQSQVPAVSDRSLELTAAFERKQTCVSIVANAVTDSSRPHTGRTFGNGKWLLPKDKARCVARITYSRVGVLMGDSRLTSSSNRGTRIGAAW